ncbi:D-sedoheptulose 7-phosphate isomerase [Methylobacterium symbioticum]|jgi:D-sedoheptulose 7-phosphate isomerase|uniref:Phosphoheptose isomerase n=1 Tax=Methylobacterium symbioticum TaxID=2584084 RepID=A0A509EB70_9HYPH|nr:D-sedoheptulose 7-phosphate isomerase [Methylobacterium symbioticum]VUD70795.1 Phosphoheptose isomerase [Methylobacterium symbioticum]
MSVIVNYLTDSRDVVQAALDDQTFIASVGAIADAITASLRDGGKLLTIGNGGSAGDAQHIAGEFVSRLNFDRAPLPAIALTTDTSVITAIGNDYGYESVFKRQVLALGRPGDVLMAISTSGRSPSVLQAMDAARENGLTVVAFTGLSGGDMPARSDLVLHAPSNATPLIQQIHITAAHIVCGIVEAALFPRPEA